MYGDPSGINRNQVSGSSVIAALAEYGIYVRPAPRMPIDEGIIIVQNLMERENGFAVDAHLQRVQQAVQTYRWKVLEDSDGRLIERVGKEPVHDWTSHIGSAIRYLAIGEIGLHPRRTTPSYKTRRGTWGYALDQLSEEQEIAMNPEGETRPRISWHTDESVELRGLFED